MNTHKILIVEDNALNLELATDLLQSHNFEVVSARSAEVAVNLAVEAKPDLILMDLSLPGMDGLEATRALKADPNTAAIPVIAVTAHAMKGDEQKALAAGCAGYITKPIDTRSFATQIALFLETSAPPSGAATDQHLD